MRFELLVRGGEVASSRGVYPADVGVVGGRIAAVGALGGAEAEDVLDARGLAVLPGVIDTQVHFREPGMEHKEDLESGSRSALEGGVTTVFEMPNTAPPTTTRAALDDKLRRAEGRMWCNYAFFVGASPENVVELASLEELPGVPGVKIFMGSSTGSLLVADQGTLLDVLRSGRRRCAVHAEDHALLEERKRLLPPAPSVSEHPIVRDAECALRATKRLLAAAEETLRPVHVLHVSTADELPLLRSAKRRGLDVSAEVTPQHLWFAAPEVYQRLGTLAQMNPPIRSSLHRDALRKAVRDGLFDVFGSDHAPHTLEEKARPYPESPSGMPGVQTLVPALLTLGFREGLCSLERFVAMACENPARLYRLVGKGHVEVGYDADLTIVDLRSCRVVERGRVASKCGWSPFEGEKLLGWPVHVVVGGKVRLREGVVVGSPSGAPCRFEGKADGDS